MKEFKVLDLFCGAGGFSYGLEMNSNFKTVLAIDNDFRVYETFNNNIKPKEIIIGDLTDENLLSVVVKKSKFYKINVIIGGPPCQGFSLKGKNLGKLDERNFLFLNFLYLVKKINPEIFVIENVPNILKSENGYFLKKILDISKNMNYFVNWKLLNSKNFSVPQNRLRAFIIGSKYNKISFIEKNVLFKESLNVKNAISDLNYLDSNSGNFESDYMFEISSEYQKYMRKKSKKLYNHISTNHSKKALSKLKMIPKESGKEFLPKELHGNQKFKSTWSRLVWDELSPTIDTRFDTPSNGKNSHPELNRSITPREAARFQSFPDDFIFYGKKTSICKQIGNAVPPLVAYSIGISINNHYKKKDKNGTVQKK